MKHVPTLQERFESRVDRSAGPDLCHPWKGLVGGAGGPCMSIGKTSRSARRLAWEFAFGPIPKDHLVMIACPVKLCVNHRHFWLKSLDPVNAFWRRVRRDPNGCWMWTGEKGKGGYGMFERGSIRQLPHRYSYELHHGRIEGHVPGHPELEWCVCHHCDTPGCVNPAHLFLGRDADNAADKVAKGRHRKAS